MRERRAQVGLRCKANRLSAPEQTAVLAAANAPRFASLSPQQIVPALADEGCYAASESTFCRLLRDADQLARRGRAKAPARVRPSPLEATRANQVWSRGTTYPASTVQGPFFSPYLIMDLYSRKIRRLGYLPAGVRRVRRQRLPQGASARRRARRCAGPARGQRFAQEGRHHTGDAAAPRGRAVVQPPSREQ